MLWGGGGALVLVLVLPWQEHYPFPASLPEALTWTLNPVAMLRCCCSSPARSLAYGTGISSSTMFSQQELHPSSSAACSLGMMPSFC